MRLRKLGPNQHEVSFENGTVVLFSYETPVAAFSLSDGHIRTVARFSKTTTKHINSWLKGIDATPVDQETILNLVKGK